MTCTLVCLGLILQKDAAFLNEQLVKSSLAKSRLAIVLSITLSYMLILQPFGYKAKGLYVAIKLLLREFASNQKRLLFLFNDI